MTAESGQQERELVDHLRAGDEAVFAALVRQWTPAMLRLAENYVPNRQVAEEVVQDSWLAVLHGIAGFEQRSSLRTWVFHIVVRRAQQTGIREHRSLPFSSVWREERAPAVDPSRFHPAHAPAHVRGWISPPQRWDQLPDQRWTGAELHTVIETAISRLPRRQRQVVTARDVWGLDPKEVCALLAISDNYQRVLLHRARATLRAVLETHLAADLGEGQS